MKKSIITVFILTVAIQSAFAWGWAVRDAARQSSENPSFYLGDQVYFSWDVNSTGWGATYKKAGIGTINSSAGMNWQDIIWVDEAGDGYGGNEGIRSSTYTVTTTGTWYYSLWLGWGSGIGDNGRWYNGSDTWNEGSGSFISSSFTVNALDNPTSTKAITISSSQIDLSWDEWEGRNVMIVCQTSNSSWTAPAQGTTYSVGATLGSGKVVYNSNGTSFSSTELKSSTTYYYKFYSENYSYYSTGVVASASTSTVSTDYFRSQAPGDWSATGTWQSSYDNTNWVNATLAPTSSANTTTVLNSHTVSVTGAETINNLTINSGGVLQINSTKSLTVSGTLTNNASPGIVIESGGSLITNGSLAGTGTATVERNIASDFTWHFLSSPVASQDIWSNFAPTPTSGSDYLTYSWGSGPYNWDFYYFNPNSSTSQLYWVNLKLTGGAYNYAPVDQSGSGAGFGTTTPPKFTVGRGYLVAYSTGWSATHSFTGTLNSGDKNITLVNGGNTWNLLGNPFPSAIDWDGVNTTNLDGGYYYIYNEAKSGGAGYEYYLDASHKTGGTSGKISVAQGFFVKASGTSLTLPNSARVHDNNWLKSDETTLFDKRLELKLSNGTKYDEAYVMFEPGGITGLDNYDAYKLFSMDNSIPQIYSIVDGSNQVAFNSLPADPSGNVILGLYIPATTSYTLTADGIDTFNPTTVILLVDLKTGSIQNLKQNPTYTFSAVTSDDPARFVIHFSDADKISIADGSWYTASNWSPAGVPTASQNVVIATAVAIDDTPLAECNDLTIYEGQSLTIHAGKYLTVHHDFYNAAGDEGLIINSDANGTGSLINGTSGVGATVKRYFPGSSQAWHFLSSPVAAQAIDPEFTATLPADYDFFAWYEPEVTWVNFKNTTVYPSWDDANGSTGFTPGKGYLVEYNAANPTKQFQGGLNAGTVSLPLTINGAGDYAKYNLAGNPYPSAIDWKADPGWSRDHLAQNGGGYDMSIWNDAAGNYASFNSAGSVGINGGSRYIAVGQGFMVKAVEGGSLGMDDRVRVHDAQAFLKSDEDIANILRMKVTGNVNTYSDEIVIEFGHPDANGGAGKIFSFYETAPSLYTVKQDANYSIDFRGEPGPVTIPVSFKAGADGNYTVTASQLSTFAPSTAIFFEDLKAGKTQDLMQQPSYSFDASKNDNAGRFRLTFGGTFGTGESRIPHPVSVYATGNTINIVVEDGRILKGDVSVYNMIGQPLLQQPLDGRLTTIRLEGSTGYYLVRVVTAESTVTTKVFIN